MPPSTMVSPNLGCGWILDIPNVDSATDIG